MNTFEQVFDRSNRRIRGLWLRNGSYYAQTTVIDPSTGLKKLSKVRLKATTTAEATQAMYELFKRIKDGETILGKGGPDFKTFKEHYVKVMRKSPKTIHNEEHFLNQWQKFLGADVRIGHITTQNVLAYRAGLMDRTDKKPCSPRTVNLHTRALKQLLLLAKTEGHIIKLPTEGIKQIREKNGERPLYSTEELINMGTEALRNHNRSGKQFADYILLLMFSGARCSEALNLKWEHVDWRNEQLVFPGNISKGETRRIDFNRNLKNHLLCMKETKDSDYLFPSGRSDIAVTSFKKIMNQIRHDLAYGDFTFHLTRHYFISQCVMKGIDYMTIAKWVGHKDGGILIGKIYGHLNREHMKEQAGKL